LDSVYKIWNKVTVGRDRKTSAAVLSLLQPLLLRRHTPLCVENLYTLPTMTQNMKSAQTDCDGTVLLNSKKF
jgi:hypothetical protein